MSSSTNSLKARGGVSGVGGNAYSLAIAMGLITGAQAFSFFGERPSATNDSDGEDLWPGLATVIPHPSPAGEQMSLVSDDPEDGAGTQTGVLEVEIHYIDANGDEQVELKTMNGTTPVHTIATNIRFVQKIHSTQVGTALGVAVGNISIYKFGAPTTIYSMIESGGNMANVCQRMVPAGKSLYITGWNASQGSNQTARIRLRSTSENGDLHTGVFLFKDSRSLQTSASTGVFDPPLRIPALAVVKVSGWMQSVGASLSATVVGVLVDD